SNMDIHSLAGLSRRASGHHWRPRTRRCRRPSVARVARSRRSGSVLPRAKVFFYVTFCFEAGSGGMGSRKTSKRRGSSAEEIDALGDFALDCPACPNPFLFGQFVIRFAAQITTELDLPPDTRVRYSRGC